MLAEFSIIPVGKGESVSQYIAQVVDIVDKSNLSYRINPMGTVVEGHWDEVLDLIKKCHETMRKEARRVITTITIDDREEYEGRIVAKVASIEKKLGRSVEK